MYFVLYVQEIFIAQFFKILFISFKLHSLASFYIQNKASNTRANVYYIKNFFTKNGLVFDIWIYLWTLFLSDFEENLKRSKSILKEERRYNVKSAAEMNTKKISNFFSTLNRSHSFVIHSDQFSHADIRFYSTCNWIAASSLPTTASSPPLRRHRGDQCGSATATIFREHQIELQQTSQWNQWK